MRGTVTYQYLLQMTSSFPVSRNIWVYYKVKLILAKEANNQTKLDYIGENGELMLFNPTKPSAKDS